MSRVGALVTVTALVAGSFAIASSAQAEVTTGNVVVKVVNQFGDPVPGIIEAIDSAGTQITTGFTPGTTASSFVIPSLPAGAYGLESLSNWGGLVCAGMSSCSSAFTSDGVTPGAITPVVTVAAGTTTSYTMTVVTPTISGATPIGSTISLKLPQGIADLQTVFAMVSPGFDPTPAVQWMRGGVPIPGAVGQSYVTTQSDNGRPLSAALTQGPGVGLLSSLLGAAPYTTNSLAVDHYVAATKTKASLPKTAKPTERVSVKVKVTSPGAVVTGAVLVKVGRWTGQRGLANGTAYVTLPRLRPGKYKIQVSYAGSAKFKRSAAATKTLVIKAKRQKRK
jgi:hypothetical protein